MRVVSITALVVTVAVVLLSTCCQAGPLRDLNDDVELPLMPRPRHYRDFNVMHRAIRDEVAFDDYGHMRFGRSGD